MRFTDPQFLFQFLPATCFLFYVVARTCGRTAALFFLVVASLVFYGDWGLRNLAILVCSFSINFIIARSLIVLPVERHTSRLVLHLLGQALNFGALFWFKYRVGIFYLLPFFSAGSPSVSFLDLAIPVGISFYTFQQAIFLLDAYYVRPEVATYLGAMRGIRNTFLGYVRYAFFVLFFPHLIIGPIIYLDEFEPQVADRSFGRVLRKNLEVGLVLFIIGLFKKVVLADHLGSLADPVFDAVESHRDISTQTAWFGALAYYGQLYFDFSGYSDMALGCARLFGIRYPINFYSPLKAVSISDYYRRWHITLTRAIARFLFTPLSLAGARFSVKHSLSPTLAAPVRLWVPLILNFEVIALWHGARLTFVLFGLFHGTWYVVDTAIRGTKAWKSWVKRTPPSLRTWLGRTVFTVLMILSFTLFRSSSVSSFVAFVQQMFSSAPRGAFNVSASHALAIIGAASAVVWLLPNSIEFLRRDEPGIMSYEYPAALPSRLRLLWRPNWLWAGVLCGMAVLALYYATGHTVFLYQGF